jgi:hypothetical protein
LRPIGLAQDTLGHQRVDVHDANLQQVQRYFALVTQMFLRGFVGIATRAVIQTLDIDLLTKARRRFKESD